VVLEYKTIRLLKTLKGGEEIIFSLPVLILSRDSSVGITTKLRAGRSGF
jgi:hypothetical protein